MYFKKRLTSLHPKEKGGNRNRVSGRNYPLA